MTTGRVAVAVTSDAVYPATPPYHPSEVYPEYPFGREAIQKETRNAAYRAVRAAFRLLGWDAAAFGTKSWNPLGKWIRPGSKVVVKPNWVHHALPGDPRPEEILITHPAVLRAVLDYVLLACGTTGRIVLGDAPLQSADFDRILAMSHVDEIVAFYRRERGVSIEVEDFRATTSIVTEHGRVVPHAHRNREARARLVDLGQRSFLEEVAHLADRFRVLDYDPRVIREHHHAGRHCYLIAGDVLSADVVVNIPKLKTHCKSGLTCALKNLVGINADKAFLPHFRTGSPRSGGDDYPRPSLLKWGRTAVRERLVTSRADLLWRLTRWVGRQALRAGKSWAGGIEVGGAEEYAISSGHWYGNDTTWRMVLDLNWVLAYADGAGRIMPHPQRNQIIVADAIVAGEGNGPLNPTRRPLGAVLAGQSPVAVDLAAAQLMGFEPDRIPLLRAARTSLGVSFPADTDNHVVVITDHGEFPLDQVTPLGAFRPPDGWIGHIERQSPVAWGVPMVYEDQA
jgi:uncharacterized protein (DUF362 family)